jgi:hypothetical protein
MRRTLATLTLLLFLTSTLLAATGTTSLKIAASLTNALDLVTVTAPLSYTSTESWTDGTAANQFQVAFTDTRSTDSTGEDLDLAGALTSSFGRTLTFTAIKVLSVEASSSNTNNVILTGGTSPVSTLFVDTSDAIIVRPGGTLTIIAPDTTGYAVTAGSADDIKIYSSGTGTVSYSIVILGEGSES